MRTRLFVAVLFLAVGAVAGTASASGFFTDDDGSVHEASIEAVFDAGITVGCNPPVFDEFCPGRYVTRAQMATFLVRAKSLPAGEWDFVDIDNTVHADNIRALAAAGITVGCNGPVFDRFCPGEYVTRGQMATFLVRAFEIPEGDWDFTDIAGNTHEENIKSLAAAGITVGCNGPVFDQFCPWEYVTRAQMATFLARAIPLDTSPRVVVTPNRDLFGIELGTSEAETVAEITALLGPPTEDGPYACPYIVPDNMRLVRWGSLEVTIYTVDSGSGLGFAGWRYGTLGGVFEAGGPLPEHVELPYGLELLDRIGDAATASGQPIENTNLTWRVVDIGHARIEADGFTIDPEAPITGVDVGVGFECE